MAHRINLKYTVADGRAKTMEKSLAELGFGAKVRHVEIVESYLLDIRLTSRDLAAVAKALTNLHIERSAIDSFNFRTAAVKNRTGGIGQKLAKFDYVIEVGFLPGVTDNVGNTVKETIEDLLKKKMAKGQGVYSSRIFFISGQLKPQDLAALQDSLYNPLIQRATTFSSSQFKRSGIGSNVPRVRLRPKAMVSEVNLNVGDKELETISVLGIAGKGGAPRGPLALEPLYMKAIQAHFKKLGRNPTDIELESISQTWSEHCKHTIFADPIDELTEGLYRTYIQRATNIIRRKKGADDFCISVFTDNSGAIALDKNFLLTHKVETHNSPSALDPFGGAITGIVGVNRDVLGFGMGAKPIANVFGFCFASPKQKRVLYRDQAMTQKMLAPQRIIEGVVRGVNAGGNCSGIPTVDGFVRFNDRYQGKPLVFVGTLGLIPRKIGTGANRKNSFEKHARPGDYIVMAGGQVGQDGIHGATFSSVAMDTHSPAAAVQIGDPITQKKLSDVIVREARDANLYNSITDNGAGGISCSVAEMAKECGGCEVNLDKVPLKYPGLEPWKIWISESQERMTFAVPKNKWAKFSKLMKKRGVEASVIGQFTDSGRCIVKFRGKKIMDLGMDFLHNGLPKKHLFTRTPAADANANLGVHGLATEPSAPQLKKTEIASMIIKILQRPNIGSFEAISQQYDHEVLAESVIKPLQGRGRVNGDAAVIRPLLSSDIGVVVSHGINPEYSEINPYDMAGTCIDTAIRNAVVAGADINYLALLDNFCWCSSDDPLRLWQLKEAARACFDYAVAYETPYISGKDSMFNDFRGFDQKGNPVKISVPPTLLISSVGVIADATKAISMDAKFTGDLVYLLGETKNELGGSEFAQMFGSVASVPHVDPLRNRKLYIDYHKCNRQDLVSAAISVGRGGLAAALMKMAIAGGLGMDISLTPVLQEVKHSVSAALFSESQGRILATVNPENKQRFEELMSGNHFSLLGKISASKKVLIKNSGHPTIAEIALNRAARSYKSALKF